MKKHCICLDPPCGPGSICIVTLVKSAFSTVRWHSTYTVLSELSIIGTCASVFNNASQSHVIHLNG